MFTLRTVEQWEGDQQGCAASVPRGLHHLTGPTLSRSDQGSPALPQAQAQAGWSRTALSTRGQQRSLSGPSHLNCPSHSTGTPPQQHPLFWELHGAQPCLSPQSYAVHVPVPGRALNCTVGTPVSCCSNLPLRFPRQQEPAVLPHLL